MRAGNEAHWLILGEFMSGNTDCAGSKTLLPSLAGSFHDGTSPGSTKVGDCKGKTGTADQLSAVTKVFLRKHFEAQVAAGEAGSGWIFWMWKTETAGEWGYYVSRYHSTRSKHGLTRIA